MDVCSYALLLFPRIPWPAPYMAFDKTPPSHKKSSRLFKIILSNKFATGKLDITEEKE
jgi:hypothetical protein